MKSLLSALALSLALPGAAMAQNVSSGPVVAAGNTLLSLNAEGRVARAPDLAVFTAGVTSQGQTAGAALAANAADMTKVIAALKRAGIADKDIQTSNLNLNPIYAPQRQLPDGSITPAQPTIIGYQVSNQVTVRQRNLREFGRVIDTLVAAGANQVNGPSFEIDNADSALDEARVEAIKKARARADLYARAAGMRVVRILTEPRNALLKQYAKLLSFDGAELAFTPDAIQELAARAREKGTGARALRAMVERLMRDVMFEIPGSDDIAGVTVNRAVVRGEAAPLVRRKERQAAA